MSGLPSVATSDWCDSAAMVLGELLRPALSILTVCRLKPDGKVETHEVSGVALTGGRGTQGEAKTNGDRMIDSRIATLRVRSTRLDSLGFEVGDDELAQTIARPVNDLANGNEDWKRSGLAKLWQGMDVSDLMVGIAPLNGGPGSRRVLIAQIASLTPDVRVNESDISVLRALLPLLCEKTRSVLGEEKTEPTRWLTSREQQVLAELTLGKSVRSIAESMGRSPHTVHDHVKSLHRKLGASSRGELIARALGHLSDESSEVKHHAPDRDQHRTGHVPAKA